MSGRLWEPSTKAAHTGSGVGQDRGARSQYFSMPHRSGAWTFDRQPISSNVCAHNRWRGNAGSASGRPPASGTIPVTSSASNAEPRSTRAAASADLPIPLRPRSSTAPASVAIAAACNVTTLRCCNSTVNGVSTKKAATSSASPPSGSIRTSRPSVTRYRATPSICSRKAPGRACQMWALVTWPGPAGSVAGTVPQRTVTSGSERAGSGGSGRRSNGRGMSERTRKP